MKTTRPLSVHPVPCIDFNQVKENGVPKGHPGFSNVFTSSSSKEQHHEQFSGTSTVIEFKRRKRYRRKQIENRETCIMRGVYYKNMKWQAAIKVEKKQIHLGTVGSQEEAARLYDRAAFMCGREPNFELSEEDKEELRKLRWEEYLAITRSEITNKKKSSQNLRENFVAFIKGLISFPINIPGSAYHKCLQGRKKATKMLKQMLEERRVTPNKLPKYFFDYVLEDLQRKDTVLTEAIALDLMFVLLFASFETTSLAITYAVKILMEHPHILKELTAMEQKGASKNFMAFGGGMRFCVGTDFTKVQMAVFLHCLITKYRCVLVKGGDTVRSPGLQFPDGQYLTDELQDGANTSHRGAYN
ncbi:hypothetical protein AgCh_004432 [Apium graveolens]